MAETSIAPAETPHDPRESAFFTANMAAFREHAPQIYARLAQVKTPHSRLFIDDDGAVDIAFGDRHFYREDAVAFTQRQIDAYFAAPERRFINELSFGTHDGIEGEYKRALTEALQRAEANLASQRVDQDSHFTVVFGLGLGLHLEPLIEFTGCAHLIIAEPNFDNLYHSLFIIDWGGLFDRAAEGGCAVHLVLEKDQDSIASQLRKLIRMGNPALLDGVYVYQHYGSSLLTEARAAFHRDFVVHVLGLGFFEDELLMMANAVANLKRQDVRVLATTQRERTEPVFICASGPSIDGDLEIIAAQRDRAVVVSVGSATRTLLANGIRPDIHVETENHPTNVANAARLAEQFGLSGITLLGASTVQPSMLEQFDDAILYCRDQQAPSAVFSEGVELMGSCGPVVANAALVTLLYLGFRELYLFGVDMGSRHTDTYHSADTFIGVGESDENFSELRLPAPANFGGEAVAESILSWSRIAFENILKLHPNVRCVNCSDGVRIAHAVPMLPRVLDLRNPPIDRAQVMGDIRDKLPTFSSDLVNRIWHEADLAAISHDIFHCIDALLASALSKQDDDPGVTWVYELYDVVGEAKVRSPAMSIFLFGTTCLYLGSFWWFDGRIEDANARGRFRRTAIEELRVLYAGMDQRLSVLAADVGRCLAGEISIIDSDFDI
jgi:hypothetical protein